MFETKDVFRFIKIFIYKNWQDSICVNIANVIRIKN